MDQPKTFLERLKNLPDVIVITTLALIVGIGGGFGAIFTEWLVHFVHHVFFEEKLWGMLDWLGEYYLIVIPAIGALIFAPIILNSAREAQGHGVSEVLEAVTVQGGVIRPRVAAIKSITSSLCIGSGGSVGLEGPIAQIGSSIGSTVGQIFGLNAERLRLLLACGAGAGISATFHAPITGTVFALEIILGHLEARYFSAVVISAVIADTIAQFYREPLAFVVRYTIESPIELLLYALLGIVIAYFAVGFTKVLGAMESLWARMPISDYIKPVLGGLILGVVGYFTFQVDGIPRLFGMGYESIHDALNNTFTLKVIFLLFILKVFTTSLTLGSGGTGGTFTPTLFMGAMLGGTFGHIVNIIFPTMTAPPGAYALAGMSAFFAGAAHAPMTSILVAFELTGNYELILPIMLTTVVATLMAQHITPTSMYTAKLIRRGIQPRRTVPGQRVDLMSSVTVEEVMSTKVDTIPATASLEELMEKFTKTHRHGFPVLDESEELAGIVSIKDLDNAMTRGDISGRIVADIATTDVLVTYPFETMGVALQRLGLREISRLPVVEEMGSRKLVGIVLRTDIVGAYNKALEKHSKDNS